MAIITAADLQLYDPALADDAAERLASIADDVIGAYLEPAVVPDPAPRRVRMVAIAFALQFARATPNPAGAIVSETLGSYSYRLDRPLSLDGALQLPDVLAAELLPWAPHRAKVYSVSIGLDESRPTWWPADWWARDLDTLDVPVTQAELAATTAAETAAAFAELRADLTAETAARIAGDATLQAAIDADVAARLLLAGELDDETAARVAAIAALQAQLDDAVAASAAGDTTLQDAIDAEAAARVAAIAGVQGNVDAEQAARIAAGNAEAWARLAMPRALHVAGRWYGGLGSAGSATPPTGRVFFAPIWVPPGKKFDRIGLNIIGAGSADSLVRLAIYADAGDGSGPVGAPLVDAGTVPGNVIAQAAIVIDWTAPTDAQLAGKPSLYWRAAKFTGTTAPNAQFENGTHGERLGRGDQTGTTGGGFADGQVAGAFGAPPLLGYNVASAPRVALRAA